MAYNIVGINRTSDASFCLLRDVDIEILTRKERLTREKHAWGRLGDIRLYARFLPLDQIRIDGAVECFSSDQERSLIAEHSVELRKALPLAPDAFIAEMTHHFSHAYSAFYPSPFSEAAVLVVDNRGSPSDLVGDTPHVAPGAGNAPLEVISAFCATASEGVRRVAQQVWDRNPEKPAGLGMFYTLAARAIFDRRNCEGILMGLAPLGDPQRLNLPPLAVDGLKVGIPDEWTALVGDRKRFSFLRDGRGKFSDCADLAAATQQAFEEALISVGRYVRKLTGMRNLAYAGGCALNCSANSRLLLEGGFDKIFIPPACDDGGTALGCALFGLQQLGGDPSLVTWEDDYLGPRAHYNLEELQPLAAAKNMQLSSPPDLADAVAERLAHGEVVALFQGRSESGPRALGNRSILADPRYAAMSSYLNRTVKEREWFRPFAPVMRLDDASEYFDVESASPFMQRTYRVRPKWRSRLAAVCHVDGTARIQTITNAQNPFLYRLLEKFYRHTDVGVLLNTSFNGRREPIVETIEDALDCASRMAISCLVIPPYVLQPLRSQSQMPLSG